MIRKLHMYKTTFIIIVFLFFSFGLLAQEPFEDLSENELNLLENNELFQRNFSTGEVEIDGSTIYHKTEYKERRNHYAYYSVNTPIDGYDTDRETFFGLYNGFEEPQTVLEGKPGMSVAHGW